MGSSANRGRATGRGPGRGRAPGLALVGLVAGLLTVVAAHPPAAAANSGDEGPAAAEAVIQAATGYLGVPYRLGREGPDLFDCSGLIFRAFADAGRLPLIGGRRTRAAVYMRWFAARGQYTTEQAEARRGDLVIYNHGKHIGIYLGQGEALSAIVTGVSIHPVDGLTQPVTGFLRVDWDGDGAERGVPVDLAPSIDAPEEPAELVPISTWAPELPEELVAQATPSGAERVEMRSAGSRTFEQADGTFVTEIFSRPIFHQPPGSTEWHPIELRFETRSGRVAGALVEASPVRIEIGTPRRAGTFARLDGGGEAIEIGIDGAPAEDVAGPSLGPDGRHADYAGVFEGGAGLRLFPRADGLKAFVVLGEPPSTDRFGFVLVAEGLEAAMQEDGSVALSRHDGTIAARIPAPLALTSRDSDGRGGGVSADTARLELAQDGDRLVVWLIVQPAFLQRAPYPIYLDLTIAGLGDEAAGGAAFALSSRPAANFSDFQRPEWPAYPELWHGGLPGRDAHSEAYLRFVDPAGSLRGVQTQSAALRLLPYWQFDGGGPTSISHPAEDWQAPGLTWDSRPSAGVELGAIDTEQGEWAEIDLTDHLRAIAAGDRPDHGLLLYADGSGKRGWKRFVAPAGDPLGLEPRLVVSWKELQPVPVEHHSGAWSAGELAWLNAGVAPAQTRFEVEVVDGDVPVVSARSGVVKGASGQVTGWTIPAGSLEDGGDYAWRVRVKHGRHVGWSLWSAPAPFTYGTQDWSDDEDSGRQ